ncbi:17842_t:CDS:10 [Acaulospora morrowiae]|uniref:17842_t:CDS:1 n=1 Tax=Acaulospora morrowiae TaxID=94023 RepID=A0A9N8Z2U5_9GLOM|nr:17842_t:CDS:10 [Acaulospora morrowiae]
MDGKKYKPKSKSSTEKTDSNDVTKQRLEHHTNLLRRIEYNSEDDNENTKHGVHKSVNPEIKVATVRIGDVSLRITNPLCPELVPDCSEPFYEDSQEILNHLRWIMQKEKLGQDMFLVGPPGHLRRRLVLKYAQLTNREIEYVPLSKDCTDSDLKQRREIYQGTAFYLDQSCVRAAIEGRMLILDGIEKAERNVLPILNNLLENREMALEDGRFLVHPKRYDSLCKTVEKSVMDDWKLVKVPERFIVMALGLPIPPYIGHPLDPPLRSRFQCRDVKQPIFEDQVKHLRRLAPRANPEILERLVSIATVIGSQQFDNNGGVEVPEFPASVESSILLLQNFPDIKPRFLLDLIYPWPLLSTCNSEQRSVIEATYHRFGMLGHETETGSTDGKISMQSSPGYVTTEIQTSNDVEKTISGLSLYKVTLKFKLISDGRKDHVTYVLGGSDKLSSDEFFVKTKYHQTIFDAMLMAHSSGDFCLIGEKGVGKSALIRYFAKNLGYDIEYIPLYKDMSARDLLQRRGTTFSGDTIWENSSLVKAAISGNLALMDGIDMLSFGTLVTLQRLVKEREVSLPDGRQLIHPERYKKLIEKHGFNNESLKKKLIFPVHPAFRIVALGRPSNSGEGKPGSWLSPEIVSMFQFVVVRPLDHQEEVQVLETLSPGMNADALSLLLNFANRLRSETDETMRSLSNSLSTRQLIRICRRLTLFPNESLYQAIHKASLSRFLPSLVRSALEELMINNGIIPPSKPVNIEQLKIESLPSSDDPKIIRIGGVEQPITTGEHLLLIGNQGVGKNKLADYFLQLLKLPREYIQLHRDTTVHSLTATPTIVNGILQYDDSPLVKAVKNGYILVVDEADKAPTYVTAVLRNLLEDGQMVLSDGRRIVSSSSKNSEECIVIHRNFRVIVLANRPGFPFHERLETFLAVDNPDSDSEMFLLRKYAPDVSEDLLLKLTEAFSDLRKMVDEGLISYPYSTRELVNVVKHMQQYPKEGMSRILQNVFDFDKYDKDSKDLLKEVFQKHGIPIGLESEFSVKLGKKIPLSGPVISELWTRSNFESKTCEVKENPVSSRGEWKLQISQPKEIDRAEGRTVTFTEQIYSFRVPAPGEALDVVGLDDGSLFVVTSSPVTLHAIDQEHHKILSIDLYEYFPFHKASTFLRMSIVQLLDESWYLIFHNPTDNSLLSVDFQRKTIVASTLTGLGIARSIMLKDFESLGILVFYQIERSFIVLVDFNTNIQYTIEVPIKLAQLYLLKPDVWLIRDCFEAQYYIVYAKPSGTQIRIPSIIQKIDVQGLFKNTPEDITYISQEGVAQPNVSSARFLQNNNDSIAVSIISNLPEALINATDFKREDFVNENGNARFQVKILSYMRGSGDDGRNFHKNLKNSSLFLRRSGQLATIIPLRDGRSEGYLEIFNPSQNTLWRITIPLAIPTSDSIIGTNASHQYPQPERSAATLLELSNGNLITMDNSGILRVWQVDAGQLIKAANTWKNLVGSIDKHALSIIYEDSEGKIITETAEDGVKTSGGGSAVGISGSGGGGVKGVGGEGVSGEGTGGEGAGGGGGDPLNVEGRQPTFIDVANLQVRSEAKTPLQLTEAQKEFHEMTMKKKFQQINMTQEDSEMYQSYLVNVQREIRQLRIILESTEAKNKERVWLKNQSSGDVDDTKLIEGITGDRNIYKRRGENDPEVGFFHEKPKKMYFVFDLSASMYRFNSHDRRLDRSMEVALSEFFMFHHVQKMFISLVKGHSGDSPNIEFVKEGKYPRTEKESFKVLRQMYVHSQFCLSGDNTLNAAAQAISDIVKEEADDYFVVVLSDANISQYNIDPEDIVKALKSNDKVNSFMIFIGSLQDQAEK